MLGVILRGCQLQLLWWKLCLELKLTQSRGWACLPREGKDWELSVGMCLKQTNVLLTREIQEGITSQ